MTVIWWTHPPNFINSFNTVYLFSKKYEKKDVKQIRVSSFEQINNVFFLSCYQPLFIKPT